MKLSKKVIAMLLTVVMVVTQVSVFSLAENDYASDYSDSASYAMRVPASEKVGGYIKYETQNLDRAWINATNALGRDATNQNYAGGANGYLYTATVDGERFFDLTPESGKTTAQVVFTNLPYQTYTSENPRLTNGIPATIGTPTALALRIKAIGKAADKLTLDIAIGSKPLAPNNTVNKDVLFMDAATGALSSVTYNSGIQLAGNADGWLYLPFTSFANGAPDLTISSDNNANTDPGFRSLRVKFPNANFGGKTMYLGNIMFVNDFAKFKTVHAAPEAPTVKSVGDTSIEMNAVAGLEYSIDGTNFGASAAFTDLSEGTEYTIFARYVGGKFVSSVQVATTGLVAPTAIETTYNTIRVKAIAGQEYSLDPNADTWNTTGEFTGLTPKTEYTVYTRHVGDTVTKSATFTTKTLPYASGVADGAFYAMLLSDGVSSLDTTYVAASDTLGRNAADTEYVAGGALFVKTINNEKFLQLSPKDGKEGTANIRAALLTYGQNVGLPADMVKANEFTAMALRVRVAAPDGQTGMFSVSVAGNALKDGTYTFIDATTGKTSSLEYQKGFSVTDGLDGYIVVPFNQIADTTTAAIKARYNRIDITMHGNDCGDGLTSNWANGTLYFGNALFLSDLDVFMHFHSIPAEPVVLLRTRNSITVQVETGIEYSIDNGITWLKAPEFDGVFANLAVETLYPVYFKYSGSAHYGEINVQTRLANPTLTVPTLKNSPTTTSISINTSEDHEYSIDGGNTWQESGEFTNLSASGTYSIIARIIGTTEPVSEPLRVKTQQGKYGSGYDDDAIYLARLTDQVKTNASGKMYVGKANGFVGWIGASHGRDPETGLHNEKDSDQGGVMFVEDFDGERLVEFTTKDAREGNSTFSARQIIEGTSFYPDVGIPMSIGDVNRIKAFAFRVKITAGSANQLSGVDFYFNTPGYQDRSVIKPKTTFTFISKDGAISTINYNSAVVFDEKEWDGYVIIPIESYNASLKDRLKTGYGGFTVWMHAGKSGCSHDAGWSEWTGRQFYVGDSFFLYDVDRFLDVHGAPELELESKDDTSIRVKALEGVEYCLNGDWSQKNTDGVFTGLTPNTLYTVWARRIDRTAVTKHAWYTDHDNPELVAPEAIAVSQTYIKVRVVNGLEYSIDNKVWNESGEFAGLTPETEYLIYARLKKSPNEKASALISTVAFPNRFYRPADTASPFFEVPDGDYVTGDYGWASSVFSPTGKENPPLPIVNAGPDDQTVYGRFMEMRNYTNKDGSKGISSKVMYGKVGLPNDINIDKQEAVAVRFYVKKPEGDRSRSKFTLYTNTNSGASTSMQKGEVYLIDELTGQISTIDSTDYSFYESFNGWLVIPISYLYKTPWGSGAMDPDWFRQNFNGLYPWLHADGCSHGASDSTWKNAILYMGEMSFVRELNTFLQYHGAPENPSFVKKDSSSIELKNIEGAEYSIDGGNTWQDSPVFAGLQENTVYNFVSKYKLGTTLTASVAITTDMENPPMTTPKILSMNDEYVYYEVVPGLEYYLEGDFIWNGDPMTGDWSELGVFGMLDPNTTYKLYARDKKQNWLTSDIVEFTTPKVENPYARKDGASDAFKIMRYDLGYTYNEFWFPDINGRQRVWDETLQKYVKKTGTKEEPVLDEEGNPKLDEEGKPITQTVTIDYPAPNWQNGYLEAVEIDGERFIEVPHYQKKASNFSFGPKFTYQNQAGFPRSIWLKDFWGFAARIKVDQGAADMGFLPYTNAGGQQTGYYNGTPYYLIDAATGTWKKYSYTGSLKLQGFDGWILFPFSSYKSNKNVYQYFQTGFSNWQFFTNQGDWTEKSMYVGDIVVVEDANLFAEVHAPNTHEPLVADAHNKITDPSIPAVMANDCTGAAIGDGIVGMSNVVLSLAQLKKPNETNEAVRIKMPPNGTANVLFVNDALNYKDVSQELEWQVLDSMGFSFYLSIPERTSDKIGIGLEILEQVSEYFNYNGNYYYTISNGVASKIYGDMEFNPGFNGTVMIPFENFNFNQAYSTYVDGLLYSVNTIEYFGLTFDLGTYPALKNVTLTVDDFMMWQDADAFIKRMLEIQGAKDFTIREVKQTFRIDDNPSLPRFMANDCTGINVGKGLTEVENVDLKLVAKPSETDSYIEMVPGEGKSKVLFKNYALYDNMPSSDRDKITEAEGISFWLSIPKEAPSIIGFDFEIREDGGESFWYDADEFYYTVVNGIVQKNFGYLEFEPGFEGTVVVPFANCYYDEGSSYVNGVLDPDLIESFGLHFNSADYANVCLTTISIDDIAYYLNTYDFIDAVWAFQTNNSRSDPSFNGNIDDDDDDDDNDSDEEIKEPDEDESTEKDENKKKPKKKKKKVVEEEGLPLWAIISLIAVGVVLVAGSTVLIIVLVKRRKAQDEGSSPPDNPDQATE